MRAIGHEEWREEKQGQRVTDTMRDPRILMGNLCWLFLPSFIYDNTSFATNQLLLNINNNDNDRRLLGYGLLCLLLLSMHPIALNETVPGDFIKRSHLINIHTGLTLEAGKSYTQEVDSTFRISMAALGSKIPKNAERVSVIISYAGNDFTLCSLTPGKIEQQPIDITFLEGEEITFMTQGSAVTVDLTGNYIVEMNEDDLDDDEEDLMNDEEMMMMAGEGGMISLNVDS